MNQTACYCCNRLRTGTGIAGITLAMTGATVTLVSPDIGHAIIGFGLVVAGLALFWLKG